jgi:DUF971 family protein
VKGKRSWIKWFRMVSVIAFTGVVAAVLVFAGLGKPSGSFSPAPVQDEDSGARFQAYLDALASQGQAENERYAGILRSEDSGVRFQAYLDALASQARAEDEHYANFLRSEDSGVRFQAYLDALASQAQAEHERYASILASK